MLVSKILYAVFLVILVLFWILYRGTLSLQLLLLGLLIPAVLLVILLIQRFMLETQIRRNVSEVTKGEPFQWVIQLRNRFFVPVANAVLLLEYVNGIEGNPHRLTLRIPLLAMNTQRVMLTFHAATCGMMELRLLSVKIYDPLRLFSQTIRTNTSNRLLVMPDCAELDTEEIVFPEAVDDNATEYSKHKSGDDPSEIFEIHEYRSGDAISRIHWKLSSKLDELMVKAYSLPIPSDTILLPDYRMAGEGTEAAARLDTMLSVLYAVANYYRTEGLAHSILWYQKSLGGFGACPLTEPEDTEQMLRQMIQSAPRADILESALDALEDHVRCSQMIMFTPKLDAHTVSLLPHLAEHRALTVFYVLADGEAYELPEGAEEYDCIPVQIQKAKLKEASVALEEGDEMLCEEEA